MVRKLILIICFLTSCLIPVFPQVDHEVDLEVEVVDKQYGNKEDGEDPHVAVHQVAHKPLIGIWWPMFDFDFNSSF